MSAEEPVNQAGTEDSSAPAPASNDTREDWEVQRDKLKATADDHFRLKAYTLATQSYEAALELDPTNHILLSNKSAAHLANGEKSKALHDARKCVEHAPDDWVKGHTRLAAAMASLGRYSEALKVYTKVLNDIDPNNQVAIKGRDDCRAKERQAMEEKKREAIKMQMELDRQKAEKEQAQNAEVTETNNNGERGEEDDLLDDFFSEVEKATEKPMPSAREDSNSTNGKSDGDDCTKRIKLQLNDLGTSTSQINRLLQTNYEWKNLNPFYVLDIPHTIEDESIISARYRALSLLVHPDKCPDDPVRAKKAFEQVRNAMTQMNDDDKRRHVKALLDEGHKQGRRDWEEELSKRGGGGVSSASDSEGLAQAQSKATMKIFAEIEQRRREVDRRKRKFEQRERAQEDEEKAKEKSERDHDKKWREGERVDKRVGNWRDFQVGGKKKK